MNSTAKPPVTPKDAAAMVLLRDPEDPKVFWVKRSRTLSFMGHFHAFPGGQRDEADALIPIRNANSATDEKTAILQVAAIREVFEETGVLIARGVERLSREKLAEMRCEQAEDQISFGDLLARQGLTLDGELLVELPRWVTPPQLPRRYDTRFFAAWLPEGQEAEVIPGELEEGEWVRPKDALQRWSEGECLFVTPITTVLQALSEGVEDFAVRLHSTPQSDRDHWESRVEFRRGFFLCALRTPTIPPATHTNCYIVGGDEMVVIDPGSPYPDQQHVLDAALERFIAEGSRIREILITHLHPDHIGGVMHLAEKFNLPVATHKLTAEAIKGEIRIDRIIEDNDLVELHQQATGLSWRLRALWTPGHARGHLSFYEERTGTLITGDCVVGFGTVVIAPPEGNMNHYLASLRRYLELPKLTALMPGHGPVIADARSKIEEYIVHRTEREQMIVRAMSAGASTPPEIVKAVYTDVPEAMHQLAELSVRAHLEKLESDNRIVQNGSEFKLTV